MELEHAYEILKLQFGVSIEEVKRAYHSEALLNHPDQHQFDNEFCKMRAEERFKDINEAYHTILEAQPEFNLPKTNHPQKAKPNFELKKRKVEADEFVLSAFRKQSNLRNNPKIYWSIALITPLLMLIGIDPSSWRSIEAFLAIYATIACTAIVMWLFRDFFG